MPSLLSRERTLPSGFLFDRAEDFLHFDPRTCKEQEHFASKHLIAKAKTPVSKARFVLH